MVSKKKLRLRVDKKLQLENKISGLKTKTQNHSKKKAVLLKKSDIQKAIKFLNQTDTRKPNKVYEGKRRARKCKLPIYQLQQNDNVYDPLNSMSYLNISRHMRTCILNHDWNNLTKLLILFFDAKNQNPIKFRNAFINLLNNPDAIRHNSLDEFLQMFVCCQTEEQKITFMNNLLNLELVASTSSNNEVKMDDLEIDEILSN